MRQIYGKKSSLDSVGVIILARSLLSKRKCSQVSPTLGTWLNKCLIHENEKRLTAAVVSARKTRG